MFSHLVLGLRTAGLPASITEYLTLMAAMRAGVAEYSIEDFYYLARATLVKDERHLDRFDRVFAQCFKGLEPPEGIKVARPPARKRALTIPTDFSAALKKNKRALATFEAFSPSNKREYVEWITEAKREETRNKRLAQAVEWMAEGKARNWKYENC